MARSGRTCSAGAGPRPTSSQRVEETIALLRLDDVADRPIEALSLGRGRIVEVGRALMTQPRLLLLDEPSSGLDHRETLDLVTRLREVNEQRGTAILLVEHDVEMVRSLVSRVFVLDFGTLDRERADRRGLRRGRGAPGLPRRSRMTGVTGAGNGGSAPLLELRDVEAGYGPFKALFGINFAVERGRVLTLLGSNGSRKDDDRAGLLGTHRAERRRSVLRRQSR